MRDLKVLTVDDDAINLKLLEVMLKKYGKFQTILQAKNGLDALAVLEVQPVDLILLDIVMPVMNGLEFLDNLHARESISHIPVIVLTTDETAKREALNKGAYDFMTKPINDKDLHKKLDDVMNIIGD